MLVLILGFFSAPPCLANIKCVRPLYIILSLLLLFRALRSCSPMHLKYALNASISNMLCGSWIIILGAFGEATNFLLDCNDLFCLVL